MDIVQKVLIAAIPLLLAITLHEAAHGYVAKHFGDKTAWMLGRVTLNPLKHIDPIGTIAMPLALYWLSNGAFSFGYAKPVPVNMRNLHNPKRDMVWVAAAGPAVNLVQGLIWAALLVFAQAAGVQSPLIMGMCQAGIWVNVIFFVFNLLPLPPLDGGRILTGVLPEPASSTVSRIEPFGFFIVIGLLVTNILDKLWLQPVGTAVVKFILAFTAPLRALLL